MLDHKNRCIGKTKKGKPCRAAATASGYCYLHSNPGLAAELGRLGGRRNRRVIADNLQPLPPMDTAEGVTAAIEQVARDLHGNRLLPKKAGVMGNLLTPLLRARREEKEQEFEQKLKQMQAQIDRLCAFGAIGGAKRTEEGQHDKA